MAADVTAPETAGEFQKILDQYPREKRYIIPLLHDLRKRYRYLPEEALEMTATHFQVPFSHVYGIATFYRAFSLVPKGRFTLRVCDGTTCHIKGSRHLIDEVHACLGINPDETTEDRRFSMETVNCIGACALSPAMLVDEKVYARVTPAGLNKIVDEYRGDAHEPDRE